jgi:Thiamine pyrophosphate enzyme, central domain
VAPTGEGRVGVTAGLLLARVLAAGGVGAVYGLPLDGVPVTEVTDAAVAVLLAQAHRAVHGVAAAAHIGDGTWVMPGPCRGGDGDADDPVDTVVVEDVETLRALAPLVAQRADGSGLTLQVRIDLARSAPDAPADRPSAAGDWTEPGEELLCDVADANRVVVLAGPGVVERRAVGGLRALAAAGRLGVLNTWGAKGVFHWQSRHHWATVGLQARDFELGGIAEADLVLAVGVDEREAPRHLWAAGAPVREVAPEALGALAECWPAPVRDVPGVPPLRERLAAVTQAGWAAAGTPLMPSRVTRDYAQVLGESGLVAADAGTAGFWVARTFATTRLGSVLVPAAPIEGWAAACVLVARLVTPLRPALAVVDGGVGERGSAVLAEAARLGVGIGIEAWDEDEEPSTAENHLARLDALVTPVLSAQVQSTLATDPRQLADMVEAAGPVRAWTGDERLAGMREDADR